MSTVTSSWRERRQAARTRRALDRALAGVQHHPNISGELQGLSSSSIANRLR